MSVATVNIQLSDDQLEKLAEMIARRVAQSAMEHEKPKTLLTYDEVAAALGRSKGTVERLIKRKVLRRHPIMTRVRRQDLEAFINAKYRYEL